MFFLCVFVLLVLWVSCFCPSRPAQRVPPGPGPGPEHRAGLSRSAPLPRPCRAGGAPPGESLPRARESALGAPGEPMDDPLGPQRAPSPSRHGRGQGLGLVAWQDRVRERRAGSCGRLRHLAPPAGAPRRSRSLAARDPAEQHERAAHECGRLPVHAARRGRGADDSR